VLIASQNSPSLVVPSPSEVNAISSALNREARSSIAATRPAGVRGAHRVQHLRAGGARSRDDVERLVAPVRRHLAAAGAGIEAAPDGREQHLERRDAELQAQCAVAIVREEPVVGRPQREPRGDLDRLVAGAADLEEDLALLFELDLLVVELTRQQHETIHAHQRVAIDLEGQLPGRGSRLCGR